MRVRCEATIDLVLSVGVGSDQVQPDAVLQGFKAFRNSFEKPPITGNRTVGVEDEMFQSANPKTGDADLNQADFRPPRRA